MGPYCIGYTASPYITHGLSAVPCWKSHVYGRTWMRDVPVWDVLVRDVLVRDVLALESRSGQRTH